MLAVRGSLKEVEAARRRMLAARNALDTCDKLPRTEAYNPAQHERLSQSLIQTTDEYVALLTEFLKQQSNR